MVRHRLGALLLTTILSTAATMHSQSFDPPGLFGPVTAHPKAGDPAPDLVFSRTLSSPNSASWTSADLSGKATVLVFFPLVSRNPQPMEMWNALVARFAGKPMQFVLVTSEKEGTLLPWLAAHPVGGWVFYDAEGQTGRAYGLEQPAVVYIGADGKIAGFNQDIVPQERTVNALLAGKITTTPQSAATIEAFMRSGLTLLQAQPPRMPRASDHRPNFPPSTELHVSEAAPGSNSNAKSMDYWNVQGFTLRQFIAQAYNINAVRVDLPPALDDDKRYDFAIVLPAAATQEQMGSYVRQGLEKHFHLAVRRETRSVEAYVLTAPDGRPPAADPQQRGGGFASISGGARRRNAAFNPAEMQKAMNQAMSLDSVASVQDSNTSIDDFCRTLESSLDRPVVNETNLQGHFNIRVQTPRSRETAGDTGFRKALRAQAHLDYTVAERPVEVLVVRPQ